MRKNRVSLSSEHLLGQLVRYARKVPEGLEALPVPDLVRMVRHALRMTQAQLAKRAGIPQSHLAKIETGKVDVRLNTLRKIFRAMFCELVLVPKFQKSPQAAVVERIKQVACTRCEEKRMRSRLSSEMWDAGGASLVGEGYGRGQMPVRLVEKEEERADLDHWLRQSPAKRVAAVEFLREQYYALSGYKALPRLAYAVQLRDRPA